MLTNLLYFIFIFVIIIIFLIRTGQMDTTSVKCLINSISRFILLVSCQTMKPLPIQKDYRDLVGVLKPLKAVLDEVVDSIIPSDEILYKQCEELDMAVDEAREFIENWSPKMSKICSVSNLLLTYFPGSIVEKKCYLRQYSTVVVLLVT
jgi:hypothetical protein